MKHQNILILLTYNHFKNTSPSFPPSPYPLSSLPSSFPFQLLLLPSPSLLLIRELRIQVRQMIVDGLVGQTYISFVLLGSGSGFGFQIPLSKKEKWL
mmetsp:Transcript_2533/g.3832  ORF Transcript_2533/g.3832 Transcript_2533/m.3832 type:complete len:97 (+) Transcript_2533:157-447(+)